MPVEHPSRVLLAPESPNMYKEALISETSASWELAIPADMDEQHKNRTWTVALRLESANILTSRWVFKVRDIVSSSRGTIGGTEA